MSEGSNGNNLIRVAPEDIDFTVTIHHNVVTKEFEVSGFSSNMLIARMMCENAAEMIKREMLALEMAARQQAASRVVAPGMFVGKPPRTS